VVVVKEPKQISTGLTRMSALLTGKMTLDQAIMLHSVFPITPTWCTNSRWVRPRQIGKGSNQAVVG
jgi:hypothetical protein